jgi:CRISPR/Cas system-associated exonuclease Cas4 (RecB family)
VSRLIASLLEHQRRKYQTSDRLVEPLRRLLTEIRKVLRN